MLCESCAACWLSRVFAGVISAHELHVGFGLGQFGFSEGVGLWLRGFRGARPQLLGPLLVRRRCLPLVSEERWNGL